MAKANQCTELQYIDVNSTTIEVPFQDLFSLDNKLLKRLMKEINRKGFLDTSPLILGRGSWISDLFLVDGYHRFECVKKLGITRTPVLIRDFPTYDDAIDTAVEARIRTKSKPENLLTVISFVTNPRSPGRPPKSAQSCAHVPTRKYSEDLAEMFGIGSRTVEKALAVLKDEDLVQSVRSGELSLNQAYNLLKGVSAKLPRPNEVKIPESQHKHFLAAFHKVDPFELLEVVNKYDFSRMRKKPNRKVRLVIEISQDKLVDIQKGLESFAKSIESLRASGKEVPTNYERLSRLDGEFGANTSSP